MQVQHFTTTRTARYISLGEPGPGFQHICFCLHGREQNLLNFASQLVNLDTPEGLLILPEGLSRYALPALETTPEAAATVANWFAPESVQADLTGLSAQLRYISEGGLTLAALGAASEVLAEPSAARPAIG